MGLVGNWACALEGRLIAVCAFFGFDFYFLGGGGNLFWFLSMTGGEVENGLCYEIVISVRVED